MQNMSAQDSVDGTRRRAPLLASTQLVRLLGMVAVVGAPLPCQILIPLERTHEDTQTICYVFSCDLLAFAFVCLCFALFLDHDHHDHHYPVVVSLASFLFVYVVFVYASLQGLLQLIAIGSFFGSFSFLVGLLAFNICLLFPSLISVLMNYISRTCRYLLGKARAGIESGPPLRFQYAFSPVEPEFLDLQL
jgi:hypothetical protein